MRAAPNVWLVGFRHAHFIAAYLHWQIGHVRPDVHLLPRGGNTFGEVLADAGKGDVVIAIALRRRPRALGELLATMTGAGARLAVFGDLSLTDNYGADWVFRCDTRTSTAVDNHATVLAAVQLLLDRIIAHAGKGAAAASPGSTRSTTTWPSSATDGHQRRPVATSRPRRVQRNSGAVTYPAEEISMPKGWRGG